jgi:hypothetical protein
MTDIDPSITVRKPSGDGFEYDRSELELTAREFAYYPAFLLQQTDLKEFRLSQSNIGNLEIRQGAMSVIMASFGVHERWLDGPFEFEPIGELPRGGREMQGTPLEEMGGLAGEVARITTEELGMSPWEFAKLDAASMGAMNLTDYEFEYETQWDKQTLMSVDIPRNLTETYRGLTQ